MDVELNGARIHYTRSGAGYPVVFLHAGVADSRMWEPQGAGLANHFDVIAPDMRGYGKSELPAKSWSPIADVLALMDALRIREAPHVVGCSIGGGVAIDFALEHSDRVSKLVLVGAGVGGQPHDDKYDELFKDVTAAEATKDLDVLNEAEMKLWLIGPDRATNQVEQRLRDLFLEMNGIALKSDFASAPTKKLEPPAFGRLAEIKAPTLVIVGDEDLSEIRDTADLLVSKIPNARQAVIHNAAHLPNLEHPDKFNRLLVDFLNG
ncbi:MAG TPA: alpha/beta fold hydrolase [Candidatus Micrarchaeaceae archaeon]|nr:alpha/beta fold hydrolase [Candidatus Micrarchaeaceae archaeon]